MGQVFSVLVVLVGIAEVLACIEHIQHGVLPAWAPRRVITEPTKWRQKQSSCDLIIKRQDSVKDSFQPEEREKREEVEESNSQNKLELNGVGVLPHEHQNLDLVSSEDIRNEWKVSMHQQPQQNASVNELSVSCDADGILCMQQTENDVSAVRTETDTSSVSQVHGSCVEHIASLPNAQSAPQGCEEKYLVPDNKINEPVKADITKRNINEEMINIIDSITNQQNLVENANIPQKLNNNKQQLTIEILENKIGEGNVTKLSYQEFSEKSIIEPSDDLSIKNNNIIQQAEHIKDNQILQSYIPELTMNNVNNEKTSPDIDFNQTEINSQSVANDDNFINDGKPIADVDNIEKPHTHDLPREISRIVCKEEEFDVNGNTSADSVPLHVNQEPQEMAAKEKMMESLSDIPAPATQERSQDVIPPDYEQARQVTERIQRNTETSPETTTQLKTEEIVTSQAIKNPVNDTVSSQDQVSVPQTVCDPASQIIPDTLQTTSRQDPPPLNNTPSTPPPSPTTERASSPAATDKPSVEPPRNEHVTIPTEMKNTLWLIFSGEYTKAMSKDWHSGHFCCWQCDESLTGQRYVLRDDHPYCIKCYESVFANTCEECNKTIGIDSKDLSYKDKHWHEVCFLCSKCRVSLVDKQFGSKADKIYCGNCYDAQFASRCDGCGEIFRAGTKKMEYKTRQWHEKCFCCCVCKTPIGTKSFIPREQEIYCAGCYEEKFATRCVKCNKIITTGGVTYKNEPWHRECFTCTNCNTSLAGQRFTSRDEKPYCAECFGELFAKRCTSCSKPITGIGGTRFISFEDRHWHNDCFICATCKTSLVGRGFITDADDIICPECAKQKLM